MSRNMFERTLSTLRSREGISEARAKNFIQSLRALSTEERAEIFATYVKITEEARNPNQLLRVFSHPTYALFEEFLHDDLLMHAFAKMFICRDGKRPGKTGKFSRRKKAYIEQLLTHDEYLEFAERYGALLVKHFPRDALYFSITTYPNAAWHTWNLFPKPYPEPCSHRNAVIHHKERVFREEIADLYLHETLFEDSDVLLRKAHEDFLSSITVLPALILPASWKSPKMLQSDREAEFSEIVLRAVCKGRWFRFIRHQPQRVPSSLLHIEEISYPVPNTHQTMQFLSEKARKALEIASGLLPIGLKIHCATKDPPGVHFLKRGNFAAHNAGTCFNVPPTGSISAVKENFDWMAKRSGVSFLENPDFQIQVCSPVRLLNAYAAVLGIAYYLGSDRIRRYRRGDFTTTHETFTGDRLIIYDAGVQCQNVFAWWGKNSDGTLIVQPTLPERGRTDVLTCQSLHDIALVNLVATLLVHVQCNGYWSELGKRFIDDVKSLLARHQLSGTLNAPWVKCWEEGAQGDEPFWNALEELMDCAFQDVLEITLARESGNPSRAKQGILSEMQMILRQYRKKLEHEAVLALERR